MKLLIQRLQRAPMRWEVCSLQLIIQKQHGQKLGLKQLNRQKKKRFHFFARRGLKMGKFINVYEGGYGGCGYGGCPMPAYGLGGATMDKATVAPEVQPGQNEINASVTLMYWVK